MGQRYYYLPREIQHEDLILGEDVVSKFGFALEIEMYHETQKGWTADTSIMSKFGLQISNEMVFVVSKTAWDAEIGSYSNVHTMKTDGMRPQEGDLIYEPVTKSLLEIKYVKDTNSDFFQLGRVYQYQLTCEFFLYASEKIATGITDIDAFVRDSADLLENQIQTEAAENMISEDIGYLVLDIVDVPTLADRKYGTDFSTESADISVSIKNPFE